MIKLAIAVLAIWLIAFGIVLAVQFVAKKLGYGRQGQPLNLSTSDWKKTAVGTVRRSTRQKLMTLLNGDRKTVERLLENVRFRYPGQTENWYWEKVIYDLKRDRRA
jgi:hypothetical protein